MAPKIATAHSAPRCHHLRMNDQRCTQPALQGQIFCRFHGLLDHPLPPLLIPFVEDATSLQVAIMQVIRSLQLGKLDRRTAGTILYALQLAGSNLKYFCHEAGHPLAESVAKSKKQREDDHAEDMSLLEYLVKELELEPPSKSKHERVMQQASSLAHPPVIPSEDAAKCAPAVGAPAASESKACPEQSERDLVSSPCSSVPSVVKQESGVVDDIKACDEARNHAGSSTRMRRARKTGAPDAASSLGMTPLEEVSQLKNANLRAETFVSAT